MSFSLRRSEAFEGLNLRLFSVETPIDDFLFEETKKHLISLSKSGEYRGKDVSIIVKNRNVSKEKVESKIIKLLGKPIGSFSQELERALTAVAHSFLSKDGKNVILISYENLITTSPSYLKPMLLHELIHRDLFKEKYEIKMRPGLTEPFGIIKKIDPFLFEWFARYICNPLIVAPTIYQEVLANEKTIRLSSLDYTLPLLEGGSTHLLRSFKRAMSRWSSEKRSLFIIGKSIGFNLWKSIKLADKITVMHEFSQYRIPLSRRSRKSKIIEKNIKKAVPKRLRSYMQDVERIYSDLPENYVDAVKRVIIGSYNLTNQIFDDNGIIYPGYVTTLTISKISQSKLLPSLLDHSKRILKRFFPF